MATALLWWQSGWFRRLAIGGARPKALLTFVAALTAARIASAPTADVSFVVLGLYALTGRVQALQALGLSWLFSMISPGVAPDASLAAVGRYAVLAGAVASVLLRTKWSRFDGTTISKPVLATLLLGCGIIVHSLFFSQMRDVSLLKAIAWTATVATLLAAWSGLGTDDRRRLEWQIFGGLAALMLLSLPLLASGRGYLVNGSGFQGLLNHPQAFGTTMALLGAWLGGRVLGSRRPTWWFVGLFGLCVVLIIRSQARTGGLGLLLGLGFAALTGRLLGHRRLREFLPGLRSRRLHFVVATAVVAAIFAAPLLMPHIDGFMLKTHGAIVAGRGGAGGGISILGVYDKSRGSKVTDMWQDIQLHPWQGMGFGLPSDLSDFVVQRDPVFHLPVGAPVENGNWFLSVWEELGAFGALATLLWLWMLTRRAARSGMVPFAVFLTALFMNFGEATLFSPSGMGMLSLLLIAWAATAPRPIRDNPHG